MNFYNEVLNVLKSDERFFSDDGQLLRNAVYEAAMQMDAKLIKALYANEETLITRQLGRLHLSVSAASLSNSTNPRV